ncbi:MAG: thiol-disulfide isomerase/thioredoxin [Planctomycetota bacterium]|jgi:thiol-disulfide isomerase/thioredoxin
MFPTFLLAASLLLAPLSATREGPFLNLSFEEAVVKAKTDEKVVFIDFYTTWCGPCKQLDQTTWVDDAVVKWLGEKSVPLKIDAEVETELASKYKINAYPTLIFIGVDGKEIARIVGYRDAKTFLTEAPARLSGRTELDDVEDQIVGKEDDVQLRMDRGKAYAAAGRHEEALADFLFAFEASKNVLSYGGVRLSFLISDITSLGSNYPPAMEAMKRLANESATRLLNGSSTKTDAGDLSALNDALGRNENTLAVYDELTDGDGISGYDHLFLFPKLIDLMLKLKRYEDVLDGAGDVLKRVDEKIAQFEFSKDRYAEVDRNAQSDLVEYMKGAVVTEGAKYYEALLGVEDQANAALMVEKLLSFDPSGKTMGLLASTAARFDNYAAARDLIKHGYETLSVLDRREVKRVNRKLPKKERYEPK